MNFHRLHVFYTVARQLSFSRAAEELYTSQPNVSNHVARLEAELGVQLFHRRGTRVALTDAGRIVYGYAQRLFELIDGMQRALDELKGLERGNLRLAAGSTAGLFLLPPVMAGFQKAHPGLEISLHLANTRGAVEQVLSNQADLGFIEAAVTAPGLLIQPYLSDEMVLIAAPGHSLSAVPAVTPQDLARETLVLREEGSGTRQITEEALVRWGVQPRQTLVINGCEGVKQVVAAGLGVSFVSRRALALELAQGILRVLTGEGLALPRPIAVVAHKDLRPSAAALAFLAHLRKRA
ncbi:MAG: LysR family transcriptional regulator [Ardenticatenaceae bacterium]|nr:LysR family transcriptional regulator [Ardenticatenaceae bacterium]